MYIKFAEIVNGEAVNYSEMVGALFERLVAENQERQFVSIESELSLSDFSEFYYYKDGWKQRTKKPNGFYIWDNDLEQWLPNLDAARAAKLQEVAAELNKRLYLPCNGFDADKTSRERISGMIARLQRGDGLPAGWVGWRDAANEMHWAEDDAATVLANLTALARAIEDREQALLVASWQHKANIAALEDIDAIIAYPITEGWPV